MSERPLFRMHTNFNYHQNASEIVLFLRQLLLLSLKSRKERVNAKNSEVFLLRIRAALGSRVSRDSGSFFEQELKNWKMP